MNKILLLSLVVLTTSFCMSQDTTNYVDPDYKAEKAKAPKTKKPLSQRMYFGGTLGLSLGSNSTSILIEPMVGFKMTEKLSTGIGIGYRYGKSTNFSGSSVTYSNYIGRIFSRYVIIPKIYAHIEYMVESYDSVFYFEGQGANNNSRTIVPFLFVGGGFRSPTGKGSMIIQVLFNVLQSNDYSSQVYPSGYPYVSIGYIGGF